MPKAPPSPPSFIDPCKPKLSQRPPSGERWWHEIKFDGYRIGIRVAGGKVTVLSSRGNDYTRKVGPRIVEAIEGLGLSSAYLDGELVVEAESGLTDFGALQNAIGKDTEQLRVYLFDLLFLDGEDERPKPLIERKAMLEKVAGDLPPGSPLRLSRHFEDPDGSHVYDNACKLGVEGVVSKIRDSRYIPGDEGGKVWQKVICRQQAEFFICGYIPSTSGAIDSLYFGAREGLNMHYRGHVTVNEKTARMLKPILAKAEQPKNPFADKPTKILKSRGVRFVRPTRKVDVAFRGITEAGRLRHASFVGLRKDGAR